MIKSTEIFREYHPNGQLMYESEFSIIEPMFENAYTNTLKNKSNETFIRTGVTRRFWDNGQLNWQLNYKDDGSLITNNLPQYRKDGSVILF